MSKPLTCAGCAWFRSHADGHHCQAQAVGDAPGPAVDEQTHACERFEPVQAVGCDDCGACCREAYDSVPVTDDDRARLPPSLQHRIRVHDDGWTDLTRVPSPQGQGTWCVALCRAPGGPFRCDMYRHRPQTCRDVDVGSAGCLFARRRVGLSMK